MFLIPDSYSDLEMATYEPEEVLLEQGKGRDGLFHRFSELTARSFVPVSTQTLWMRELRPPNCTISMAQVQGQNDIPGITSLLPVTSSYLGLTTFFP